MSELKAYIGPAPDEKGLAEYYLKSEADKVIAEKDAKILALDAEVFKQKHHAKLFFDERNYAETQLRHSNRNRCLAMARMCESEAQKCLTQQGALIGFSETDRFQYLQGHFMHFSRWHRRWLALAKEPTWAKFLQLIHKEAK